MRPFPSVGPLESLPALGVNADLGLADPAAQGLAVNGEFGGDPRHGAMRLPSSSTSKWCTSSPTTRVPIRDLVAVDVGRVRRDAGAGVVGVA